MKKLLMKRRKRDELKEQEEVAGKGEDDEMAEAKEETKDEANEVEVKRDDDEMAKAKEETKDEAKEVEVKREETSKKKEEEPKTPNPTIDRSVRERKSVERLVAVIDTDSSKELRIKKGRGTALKDIPNVAYKLSRKKCDDACKLLHLILFGRRGKAALIKSNISRFSGFVWHNNEEKQKNKIKEKLDKYVKENLVEFCDILDIQVSMANTKKDDVIVKLIEFLEAPHATTSELLSEKKNVCLAGIAGCLAKGNSPTVVNIPPPTVELSDPNWVGECHLGRDFPSRCGMCQGHPASREVMPLAGARRTNNIVAAKRAKQERVETMKTVEPVVVPTIHVGINPEVTVAATGPAAGETSDAATVVVATVPDPPRQRTESGPSQKRRVAESDDAPLIRKKSRTAAAADVVDLEDDSTPIDAAPISQVTPHEHEQAGTSSTSGRPIYFDKEFCANQAAPGWANQMRTALSAVPPLPILSTKWTREAWLAVGDGLARRVAADPSLAVPIDPEMAIEAAVAEFGLAAHTVSTCMYVAWDGVRQAAARERKAQETLISTRASFIKCEQESKAKMEKTIADMQAKIDEAKALLAEKDKAIEERVSELEGKVASAENRADAAEDKLQSAKRLLSAEKGSRVKAKKALSSLEQKCKAAEDDAAAAEKRAEDVAAEAQAKTESALADYKESDAFWEPIMASYDQGLYHMARCHQRAADQGKTPTLQDLAEYTQENSFCEELVHYHPVMPFSDEEKAEYNEGRRQNGLPELEFPLVVIPNMRTFQQELEAKRKAESAAAQTEDAALQTGEVAQQTEDAAA